MEIMARLAGTGSVTSPGKGTAAGGTTTKNTTSGTLPKANEVVSPIWSSVVFY